MYIYVQVNLTPTRSKQIQIAGQLHTPMENGLLLIEKTKTVTKERARINRHEYHISISCFAMLSLVRSIRTIAHSKIIVMIVVVLLIAFRKPKNLSL